MLVILNSLKFFFVLDESFKVKVDSLDVIVYIRQQESKIFIILPMLSLHRVYVTLWHGSTIASQSFFAWPSVCGEF